MPPAIPSKASFGPRDAVPLEKMIDQVDGLKPLLESLFGTRQDSPQWAETQEELKRVAAAYARFFMTDDGKTILENLCDVTVRRPSFVAIMGVDPMQAYAQGVQREGANALLFFIMQQIAIGRQQLPPDREGSKP